MNQLERLQEALKKSERHRRSLEAHLGQAVAKADYAETEYEREKTKVARLERSLANVLALADEPGNLKRTLTARSLSIMHKVVRMCVLAVEVEEELPGTMPDAMFELARGSKNTCTQVLRQTVRNTKHSIIERMNEIVKEIDNDA